MSGTLPLPVVKPAPRPRLLIVSRSALSASALACELGLLPDHWLLVSTLRVAALAYPGQPYVLTSDFLIRPWSLYQEKILTELQLRGAKFCTFDVIRPESFMLG